MPAVGHRPQRLLAVFLQLSLLFLGGKQRHADHYQPAHLGAQLLRDLDGLDGSGVHAQQVDGTLPSPRP